MAAPRSNTSRGGTTISPSQSRDWHRSLPLAPLKPLSGTRATTTLLWPAGSYRSSQLAKDLDVQVIAEEGEGEGEEEEDLQQLPEEEENHGIGANKESKEGMGVKGGQERKQRRSKREQESRAGSRTTPGFARDPATQAEQEQDQRPPNKSNLSTAPPRRQYGPVRVRPPIPRMPISPETSSQSQSQSQSHELVSETTSSEVASILARGGLTPLGGQDPQFDRNAVFTQSGANIATSPSLPRYGSPNRRASTVTFWSDTSQEVALGHSGRSSEEADNIDDSEDDEEDGGDAPTVTATDMTETVVGRGDDSDEAEDDEQNEDGCLGEGLYDYGSGVDGSEADEYDDSELMESLLEGIARISISMRPDTAGRWRIVRYSGDD